MTQGKTDDITHLLLAWNAGDAEALDRLMPLVHTSCTGWRIVTWRASVRDTSSRPRRS